MTHLVPVIRPVLGTPFRRDSLYRRAGAMPSFHIAPASRQNAADLITGSVLGTYNSATPAMEVGPDGLLFQPAANAPVIGYDPVTLACRGARIWSVVQNLLVNTTTLSTQSRSVTAQSYTLHFTGTGTITLSGASTAGPLVGTGTGEANRVSLTFTPTAGTLTLTVSGTVSNAQLNTGTAVAPYVPSGATSASSTADFWSITGSDFTRIWGQTENTVYVDWSLNSLADTSDLTRMFVADNSANSTAITARVGYSAGSRRLRYFGRTSAGAFPYVVDGAAVSTLTGKTAFAYTTLNDFAASENGASVITDTAGDLTGQTFNRVLIGSDGTLFHNGYIRELTITPSRRPNSNLQAMTS